MKRPLRVLAVDPAGMLWGSERALLDLLSAFDKAPIAVCCPPNTPLVEEVKKIGVPVLPWFLRKLHQRPKYLRAVAAVQLLRACLVFGPTLLYINQAGCFRIANLVARLLSIPIVAHVRIFDDAEYLARLNVAGTLRGIIAISHAVADEIRKYPSLKNQSVHVIYDGYRPRYAETLPPVAETSAASVRIACVGRVEPIKGQDILVDAVSSLVTEGLHIDCEIVGSGGQFYDRLRRKVIELGLDRHVHWHGFLDEPMRVVRSCGVLVCPSHSEPLGRVIFEAWDAGVVPIAFAGSRGAAEIMRACSGGLLYSPQSALGLAAAIKDASVLSPQRRARMTEQGRRWLEENCSLERYEAAVRGVFESALNSSKV